MLYRLPQRGGGVTKTIDLLLNTLRHFRDFIQHLATVAFYGFGPFLDVGQASRLAFQLQYGFVQFFDVRSLCVRAFA
jgi:hypothetical protein